jgi:branched-chain amino acid transport system substrate-binding protein
MCSWRSAPCAVLLLSLAAGGSAFAQGAPIPVGVLGPWQTDGGYNIQTGAKLAIDQINTAGGVLGRPLRAAYIDTHLNPSEGKLAAQRVIDQDHVPVIFGEFSSAVCLSIEPVAMRAHVIFAVTGCGTDQLSESVAKDPVGNRFLFHVNQTASQQGVGWIALVQQVMEKYGYTKVALLAEDNVFNVPIVAAAKKTFGGRIVAEMRPAINAVNFAAELTQVRQSGAQVIFAMLSFNQGIPFVRQWNEQRIPALVVGSIIQAASPDFWDQTAGAAQGVITWRLGVPAPITPKTLPFVEAYRKFYGKPPGPWTAFTTYDAVEMWSAAVREAKTVDSNRVASVMASMMYQGTLGTWKFTPDHHPSVGDDGIPMTFVQWQNGRQVTIAPARFATGQIVLPEWVKPGK